MKVYISNYDPWWSFDNALELYRRVTFRSKEKFYESDYYYDLKGKLLDVSIFGWAPFKSWNSANWERKIKIRIDRYDTWSMDETLALIVLPMLVQLKETKHGAPFVDMDDVPEHLREELTEEQKANGSVSDLHFERWDWVLDEMINAFTQINRNWERDFEEGKRDIKMEHEPYVTEDGTVTEYEKLVLKRGPNHTLVEDKAGKKAEAERIQNGFKLFGKYYSTMVNPNGTRSDRVEKGLQLFGKYYQALWD